MLTLRLTGYDDEGYIHLPGGPLPISISWNGDDEAPDFRINLELAPPERLKEFEDLMSEYYMEGP